MRLSVERIDAGGDFLAFDGEPGADYLLLRHEQVRANVVAALGIVGDPVIVQRERLSGTV